MESRIYQRFRFVRALAHAVVEVYDEEHDAMVTLYEWTPDADQRTASLERLEPVQTKLHGEVFTMHASFYLAAATPAQGAEDLGKLREAGLFTGTWLNEVPPPPSPSAPAPAPAPEVTPDEPVIVLRSLLEGEQETEMPGWPNIVFASMLLLAGVLCLTFSSDSPVLAIVGVLCLLAGGILFLVQLGSNE